MAKEGAAGPSAEAIAPAANATAQLSFSGTPRYREETQPDEYVTALRDPVRRMELFDEMRSSDEGINAALATREQMIGSATWMLTSAGDDDKSREILEFCEDNIYPLLNELLRHLSGAIQYGFGAVEKVFEYSDAPFAKNILRGKLRRATKTSGRKIYLKKLAHIRQRTIHSFLVPENDLVALRQYVFTGARFTKTDIPAEKVLLWTYNRRGDDYWGTPPTRHVYKAWKFKTQMEKLNLLGFDRFGVGTPVAEEGEGWTQVERDRLAAFLASWRSGQNTYLIHPMGGKIDIKSGNGQIINAALEWVKFYELGIAKTFLTQGNQLGSTETGSRALGETFLEQAEGAIQSDCEDIASIINEHLVIPLVLWNFGAQDNYPSFIPSQRVRQSSAFATMVSGLKSAGLIQWSDGDEQWLRDAISLPDIDLQAREEEAALAAREEIPQLQIPNAAPQLALPPGSQKSSSLPAKGQLRALAFSPSDLVPAADGLTYRTPEYSEWESRVLRPEIISRDLDLQQLRLTGEVHDVLKEIDAELEDEAVSLAKEGPAIVAASVRLIAVSGRLRRKLRAAMMKAAVRTRAYGADSVFSEIARQVSPESVGPQRTPRAQLSRIQQLAADLTNAILATDPTPAETARNLQIAGEVDRAVEDEVSRRESAARNSLLVAVTQAGSLGVLRFSQVLRAAISQALEALSPAKTNDNIGGVINVAFGAGRSDAASELVAKAGGSGGGSGDGGDVVGHITGPIAKVYSAVMDGGTCDECRKWDGGQFPIDYPEDVTGVQTPNPRCAGGYNRCRCVWIYITDREVQSKVPSAKGPIEKRSAA